RGRSPTSGIAEKPNSRQDCRCGDLAAEVWYHEHAAGGKLRDRPRLRERGSTRRGDT
ncbi:unnamed protein product, partial [Sphacelaria rigidula]